MIIRSICFFLLIMCSCRNVPRSTDTIRVSVLRGPSAIALAEWFGKAPVIDGKQFVIELVDAPDLMQALLIKGETDLAVLPMISAANLYNKGIRYPLQGCPVWGTLFLVGKERPQEISAVKPVLHLFGRGTTPDILARSYLAQHQLDYTINYTFSTAAEVTQGLLAGKVETAVLGEPFLSMALQKDTTLQILADLNNQDAAIAGFPQTAILCAPSLAGKHRQINSLLLASCRFAAEHPEQAIDILEKQGVFKPGMLSTAGIERCQIRYVPVSEAKAEIIRFLQLIEKFEPEALGNKLPDDGFYHSDR